MALCDIHVADCGEHLPAWGLHDDRIPGTDQGRQGRTPWAEVAFWIPPGWQGDARGGAEAGLSWQKVQGREANRRRRRLTEPTTKASCHPPPPPDPELTVGKDEIDKGILIWAIFGT